MPCWVMPKMNAPSAVPTAEPYPPVNSVPPTTAAMMKRNSCPTPPPAWMVLNANSWCMPENHARNPTPMNSAILTLFTGTPTARALAGLPPTAKIQLPIRVRFNVQVATSTNSNHHTTVILTVTPKMSNDEAKIALALSKPCMSETFWVDTAPVTSFVTPRLTPCNTKNVPNVIRKLGIPVRTTRKPLMNPMDNDRIIARKTPTQMLKLN